MKLLNIIKELRAELIPLSYILVLLVIIGCAYQQKTIERNKKLVIEKKEELSIKNTPEVIEAFLRCDEVYFSKLNSKDFSYINRGDILKDSWEYFFKKSIIAPIDLQKIPKSCINMMTILGRNSIKSSYVFIIHELIAKGQFDVMDKVINTTIVSNLVLLGAEKQMSSILSHLEDDESTVEIYKYTLGKTSIEHFIELVEKYRVSFKLEKVLEDKLLLEEYQVGGYYPLCGFLSDVNVRVSLGGSYSEKKIKACREDRSEPYIKIIAIEKEWLEIMFVYNRIEDFRPYFEGYDAKPLILETDEQLRHQYSDTQGDEPLPPLDLPHYFVQRKAVTTPYVVTDGVYQIALAEINVSKIIAGEKSMKIEDKNTSCDNSDLVPNIEKGTGLVSSEVKNESNNENSKEVITYNYPQGFNSKNIRVRKNFYGSFSREWECGT